MDEEFTDDDLSTVPENVRRKIGYKDILYVRGLSKAVKDAFKAACARRGKTMQEVVEELMKEYIATDIRLRTTKDAKKKRGTLDMRSIGSAAERKKRVLFGEDA